jgi:hypothetical protein
MAVTVQHVVYIQMHVWNLKIQIGGDAVKFTTQ